MKVLISEVAGEGRWSQFNLLLDWVEPFFGSSPEELDEIPLCELDSSSQVVSTHNQKAIHKLESSNWAFEIPGASDLEFNAEHRPLLIVSQRNDGYFSFVLIVDGDAGYNSVFEYLNENRQTKQHLLARMIIDRDEFENQNFRLLV